MEKKIQILNGKKIKTNNKPVRYAVNDRYYKKPKLQPKHNGLFMFTTIF